MDTYVWQGIGVCECQYRCVCVCVCACISVCVCVCASRRCTLPKYAGGGRGCPGQLPTGRDTENCNLQCQLPIGRVAVHCRSSTAQCPQALGQCNTGVPLPIAHRRHGATLQNFHRPLPQACGAVQCKNSSAHYQQAVWRCIAEDPPPNAHKQCGGAGDHCPLPIGAKVVCCWLA